MVSPATQRSTLKLEQLLQLTDDQLRNMLLEYVRASGIKFRSKQAFEQIGWKGHPAPSVAKFYCVRDGKTVPSQDKMMWDMRSPMLEDEALCCCSILLWRSCRKYDAAWLGGPETSALPITAGILAVNRALGGSPLHGFYMRKQRKPDGLCQLLEGVIPPRGTRVLLVDDILNRGASKRKLLNCCTDNGLIPVALLVVVDTESEGRRMMLPICPVEPVFTRRQVLTQARTTPGRAGTRMQVVEPALASDRDTGKQTSPQRSAMLPEDVELVRLARDTVMFAALSEGQVAPTLREDGRGSLGYLPFLGRYLKDRGPVFTRISKRECKDGRWFNRNRGAQSAGLFSAEPGTFAEMTVRSAMMSARRARRTGAGRGEFHKPIWREELGDLSVFVYVVAELVETRAQSAEALVTEGHDVQGWGLIAELDGHRGILCGDLSAVGDVCEQVRIVLAKMRKSLGEGAPDWKSVKFTRMRGRWLWDPARPKLEYF